MMSTTEEESTSEALASPKATSTPNQEVGAKRRKPQKTNRLTIKSEEHFEDALMTPVSVITGGSSDADAEALESVTTVEPEPASDEQELPSKSPLLEIGVVEVGEDHTYKCPLCEEFLTSQKEFTAHIRAHNEVKPSPDPNDPTGQAKVYYCCLCGKMLSSFSSLDRHMLVHSGERPFSCQLCGQTFTTNGNMHRHKRTHNARDANLSMENGDDQVARRGGGRKRILASEVSGSPTKLTRVNKTNISHSDRELGRGRGGRVRKLPQHGHNVDHKPLMQVCNLPAIGVSLLNTVSNNSCFACSETFITESAMEAHIMSNHPNDNVRCNECNFPCLNFTYLKLHRNMFHLATTNNNTTIRSDNNPAEESGQMPQSPHLTPDSYLHMVQTFGSGDLSPSKTQNVLKHAKMISRSHILDAVIGSPKAFSSIPNSETSHNGHSKSISKSYLEKEDAEDEKDSSLAKMDAIDRESQSDTSSVYQFDNNMSSDDCPPGKVDDPVIRDMKLRGEFPCRLCSAVYPNLRALKGHNKEHLGKPPYTCNVGACTYSSNDKSTLTRHMRTHTGEKPFECKLCNYGFTTKANCERHLKNKHGKTSRDAIRNSIITHENEDGSAGNDSSCKEQFRCKVCKEIFSTSAKVITHAINEHPDYASDVDHIFEEVKVKEQIEEEEDDDNSSPTLLPCPLLNDLRPHLKQPPSPSGYYQSDTSCSSHNNENSGPDTPLDLSKPSQVLQTSLKSEVSHGQLPPVLKLQGKFPVIFPHNMIMDSNLKTVAGCQQSAKAAMVAAASGLLPGKFPFLFGGPAPVACIPNPGNGSFPFLFPHFVPPSLPNIDSLPTEIREKFQAEMKQRIQQLQQNSSSIAAPTLLNHAVQAPPMEAASAVGENSSSQRDLLRKQAAAAELKEQTEAAEVLQSLSKVHKGSMKLTSQDGDNVGRSSDRSGPQSSAGDDDTNYKTVMKNGVPTKKQKQRRYRTERPFSCNFCTARFTLRSNMERHIKQQHPENWSQKPRGSRRNNSSTSASKTSQFEHHQGDDYDDEEEEGVLDREGSTIDDDLDEEGLVIVEQEHDDEDEDDQDEEGTADLASVTKLVNSATSHSFQNYFDHHEDENEEKDFSDTKEYKKSAYSAAPHKIPCPYCSREFPWTSSLNRHILTHTGQKPYKCSECPLWFTTKSNCDRHVIRKHGESNGSMNNNNHQTPSARNHPERPFKCQTSPNSTFSSKANAKRHLYTRHPEASSDHPAEGGSSADDEDEGMDFEDEIAENNCEVEERVLKGRARFRCHICQHPVQVFCNRKTALTHLRLKHVQDYEILQIQGNIELCENLPDEEDPSLFYFKPISCLFCSKSCTNSEELRGHIEESHHKRVSEPSSPLAQFYMKPSGPAQDKNEMQLKKKRASLMDKINQLSANASSIQSSLFKQKEPEQIMVE